MVVKIDAWITITEQNWAFWVAGLFALFEFFRWAYGGVEWVAKTFGVETKRSLAQKKWEDRLTNTEKAIVEIKDASKKNVEMFLDHERQVVEKFTGIKNEIVKELNKLHDKLDEQQEELNETKEANTRTDLAMLRELIISGMRHFAKNKDAAGIVHISLSEHEIMESLFQEYFKKGGNGTIKNMYENEVKRFIIDR